MRRVRVSGPSFGEENFGVGSGIQRAENKGKQSQFRCGYRWRCVRWVPIQRRKTSVWGQTFTASRVKVMRQSFGVGS